VSAGSREPGSVSGPKVFITYRREETGPHAGRLYDAMVARFGEGNVFMDVDMAPGVDFVERITEAVAACQVLIVVMGPSWATVEDEKGGVRIADPEDFVRLEVETALRRPDVTPIPVLVSGARMPKREDLPREVRAISRRNALELSEARWRYDIERLNSTLDELLAETPPSAAAEPTALPAGGGRRRLRWVLLGAIAIAAIVVAVVVAVGGGGSSIPGGHFRRADLSHLVLQDPPGNLLPDEESGDGYPGDLPDLSVTPQGAYHNTFTQQDNGDTPYSYSEATAAVFEDVNAARGALADLRREWQGKFDQSQVPGLSDDGSVFQNTEEPEYKYAWQTGKLLQVFDLDWSQQHASKAKARRFADKMDRLVPAS
jgi:hypothetical protein